MADQPQQPQCYPPVKLGCITAPLVLIGLGIAYVLAVFAVILAALVLVAAEAVVKLVALVKENRHE